MCYSKQFLLSTGFEVQIIGQKTNPVNSAARCCYRPCCGYGVSLVVNVEAATAFAAEVPGIDHLLPYRAGAVLGIAKALV